MKCFDTSSNQTTAVSPHSTHKFEHIPVKDIVIGEALPVEQVSEELA